MNGYITYQNSNITVNNYIGVSFDLIPGNNNYGRAWYNIYPVGVMSGETIGYISGSEGVASDFNINNPM